jgi:hypothetical protein
MLFGSTILFHWEEQRYNALFRKNEEKRALLTEYARSVIQCQRLERLTGLRLHRKGPFLESFTRLDVRPFQSFIVGVAIYDTCPQNVRRKMRVPC